MWQHDFEGESSATKTVAGVCHYLTQLYGIEPNVIPLDNKSSKLWLWISNMNKIDINHSRDTIKVYSLKLAMPRSGTTHWFTCQKKNLFAENRLCISCAMCRKNITILHLMSRSFSDWLSVTHPHCHDSSFSNYKSTKWLNQNIALSAFVFVFVFGVGYQWPRVSSSRTYLANLVLFLVVKS